MYLEEIDKKNRIGGQYKKHTRNSKFKNKNTILKTSS